nr:uncharacterized protein CI109_001792 [Kwoniella shandongensis]KAA5529852.1 hypothetical protein CI109_001792 [Kwoniella shandongensis]
MASQLPRHCYQDTDIAVKEKPFDVRLGAASGEELARGLPSAAGPPGSSGPSGQSRKYPRPGETIHRNSSSSQSGHAYQTAKETVAELNKEMRRMTPLAPVSQPVPASTSCSTLVSDSPHRFERKADMKRSFVTDASVSMRTSRFDIPPAQSTLAPKLSRGSSSSVLDRVRRIEMAARPAPIRSDTVSGGLSLTERSRNPLEPMSFRNIISSPSPVDTTMHKGHVPS